MVDTTIFSTNECVWKQINLNLLGRKIVGLRGFEIKKGVEKEHIYASGADPIDIQSGNNKPEGTFKMLKFEVDLLNDAAQAAGYLDITEVPHTLIAATVEFKKSATAPIRIIAIPGLAFTEMGFSMDQGGKYTEVSLPFLAMKILLSSK